MIPQTTVTLVENDNDNSSIDNYGSFGRINHRFVRVLYS